ncbi:ketoacyl-ACP synthase III family protein [Actinokineospora pegani]|uniref:ketoacyl-ACP synthase III family protein n=1 Tax=Actinokineospora pegani TaxID=2654637 RepID=UPI0012EAF461|nr:ketoacyl-ACP synthase III family protein [Actinokineospora pegani]
MYWESTYIAGLGVDLPEPRSAAQAVADGHYDAVDHEANGIVSVLVGDDPAPVMAARAGAAALAAARRPADECALVLHASLWFQGVDMAPAASYVARNAVNDRVPAFEVLQQCNGGMGALELAATQLCARTAPTTALITTGDRFAAPGIDRWRSESGILYGDGATALLLSNDRGFARLLSTATTADNSLEQVVRGPDWHDAPGARPVAIGERIAAYPGGMRAVRAAATRLGATVRESVDQALIDGKTDISEIAHAVIPASGRAKLQWQLHQLIGVPEDRTSWSFGRVAGHLGAGDQFAGLHHALATGIVGVGDKVLLVGGGAGFTATCAVVEIVDTPAL